MNERLIITEGQPHALLLTVLKTDQTLLTCSRNLCLCCSATVQISGKLQSPGRKKTCSSARCWAAGGRALGTEFQCFGDSGAKGSWEWTGTSQHEAHSAELSSVSSRSFPCMKEDPQLTGSGGGLFTAGLGIPVGCRLGSHIPGSSLLSGAGHPPEENQGPQSQDHPSHQFSC